MEATQLQIPGIPDFDDEPTVIQVREVLDEPPPLPFALRRTRNRAEDESWIYALPEAAREVLEAARYPVESWPRAPRVVGAVAVPQHPIPSLSRRV